MFWWHNKVTQLSNLVEFGCNKNGTQDRSLSWVFGGRIFTCLNWIGDKYQKGPSGTEDCSQPLLGFFLCHFERENIWLGLAGSDVRSASGESIKIAMVLDSLWLHFIDPDAVIQRLWIIWVAGRRTQSNSCMGIWSFVDCHPSPLTAFYYKVATLFSVVSPFKSTLQEQAFS